MTTISLIAAMDSNRLIGSKNHLPWRLPADMKHFRQITLGKPVIMGRATYASIGHPLEGRRNIVMTHDTKFRAEGCLVVHSLDAALHATTLASEVIVMGGAKIYSQFISRADRLYITRVEGKEFEGDAWFPPIDEKIWKLIQQQSYPADNNNPYPYSFLVYERREEAS